MSTQLVEQKEKLAFLTKSEWNNLLRSIDDTRDKAIFLAAYTYGLRASEVGLLRLADIDFARDRLYIRRLKGSISGEWPLLPDVAKAIKRWLKKRQTQGWADKQTLFLSRQGMPIHRSTLHLLMRKYGEKANIPEHKRHFHVLQNTMKYVQLLGIHRFQFAQKLRS